MQINLEYERNYRQFVYFAKYMNSPNPIDLVNDAYIQLTGLPPQRLASYLSKYKPKSLIINTIKIIAHEQRRDSNRKKTIDFDLNVLKNKEISEFDFDLINKLIDELPELERKQVNLIKEGKKIYKEDTGVSTGKGYALRKKGLIKIKRKYFNND